MSNLNFFGWNYLLNDVAPWSIGLANIKARFVKTLIKSVAVEFANVLLVNRS